MKILLCLFTLLCPVFASASNFDPASLFPGKEIQSVNVQAEGKTEYVVLANADLIILKDDGTGYKPALTLPRFWNGGDYNGRPDFPAGIALSPSHKGDGFILSINDPSDDALHTIAKFRWERGSYRLVGETKSSTQRVEVTMSGGEKLSGRVACSKDINWLTGTVIERQSKKAKTYKMSPLKKVYLNDYIIEADYLEFCK